MSQIPFTGYVAILRGIGAPITASNVAALLGWQRAEGGSASYNPFNTTLAVPGATSYNSVGVRNYTSLQQGVGATIATLRSPAYSGVVSALRQGNDAGAVADAVGSSPWGTPNFRSDIPTGLAFVQDLHAIGAKESGGNFFGVTSGPLGPVIGAAGSAAGAVSGAVGGIAGAAGSLSNLGSTSWWAQLLLRIGFMVLGLVLITVGLLRLAGHQPSRQLAAQLSPQVAALEENPEVVAAAA